MEIGDRPVKFVNGTLELDCFQTLMAGFATEHGIKEKIIGSEYSPNINKKFQEERRNHE